MRQRCVELLLLHCPCRGYFGDHKLLWLAGSALCSTAWWT